MEKTFFWLHEAENCKKCNFPITSNLYQEERHVGKKCNSCMNWEIRPEFHFDKFQTELKNIDTIMNNDGQFLIISAEIYTQEEAEVFFRSYIHNHYGKNHQGKEMLLHMEPRLVRKTEVKMVKEGREKGFAFVNLNRKNKTNDFYDVWALSIKEASRCRNFTPTKEGGSKCGICKAVLPF